MRAEMDARNGFTSNGHHDRTHEGTDHGDIRHRDGAEEGVGSLDEGGRRAGHWRKGRGEAGSRGGKGHRSGPVEAGEGNHPWAVEGGIDSGAGHRSSRDGGSYHGIRRGSHADYILGAEARGGRSHPWEGEVVGNQGTETDRGNHFGECLVGSRGQVNVRAKAPGLVNGMDGRMTRTSAIQVTGLPLNSRLSSFSTAVFRSDAVSNSTKLFKSCQNLPRGELRGNTKTKYPRHTHARCRHGRFPNRQRRDLTGERNL